MSNVACKTNGYQLLKASAACALLAVVLAAAVFAKAEGRPANFAQPTAPPGWRQVGQVRSISGDQIFDYMNGAGEIPKACRYRSLKVFNYAGPADVKITVEVYDMGTSADAFGLYSMKREPESRIIRLGNRAALGYSDLVFWKDRYTFII
ncbi:MAG: DUF6599 family protein, partial [Armatimonadota bacterium]